MALGLLTDITSEILLPLGAEGRERLWPLIARQFMVWCVGRPVGNGENEPDGVWWPCEALVRVACNEIQRLPERVTVAFPGLADFEKIGWTKMFLTVFANTLTKTVQHEKKLERDLLKARTNPKEAGASSDSLDSENVLPLTASEDSDLGKSPTPASPAVGSGISTLYGDGKVIEKRRDSYENGVGDEKYTHLTVNVVELDYGKLYRPDPSSVALKDTAKTEDPVASGIDLLTIGDDPLGTCYLLESDELPVFVVAVFPNLIVFYVLLPYFMPDSLSESNTSARSETSKADASAFWLDYVQALKVRCVAAHCLQLGFFRLFQKLAPLIEQDVAMRVLQALQLSRRVSEEAVKDQNLRRIFQEAIFTEWGDGVEEVEMALSNVARMSHLHGSDMFFLTQEAGATKATIQMLGMLYQEDAGEGQASKGWDTTGFAKEHFLVTMKEALCKFQDSEERDGHLVDPNVWRNTSESGGKVALYCTAFADVVVGILGIIFSLSEEKFALHSKEFFPILCSLVRAESREIRTLVQRILAKQVAPMISVDPACCTERIPTKRSSME